MLVFTFDTFLSPGSDTPPLALANPSPRLPKISIDSASYSPLRGSEPRLFIVLEFDFGADDAGLVVPAVPAAFGAALELEFKLKFGFGAVLVSAFVSFVLATETLDSLDKCVEFDELTDPAVFGAEFELEMLEPNPDSAYI